MDYTENAWLAFEALEKLIIKDFNNYGEADFADRLEEVVLCFALDEDEIDQVKWLYDNEVY